MIDYLAQIISFASVFAMLAASYSLVMGTAGAFSSMHAAFFGIGAYAASLAAISFQTPFPLDLLIGGGTAAVIGVIVSLPLWRLPGEAVLVATIALQLVFSSVFVNASFTGGRSGLYGIPRPQLFGMPFATALPFAFLAIAVALVVILLLHLYLRRSAGLSTRALRDDTSLAQSFGIAPAAPRLAAWMLSAGFAGIAGGLYARFVGYIDPGSFSLHQTLLILTMLVVGGLGNVWGAAFGAILLVAVPELLSFVPSTSSAADQLEPVIYSVVLLLVVMFRPQGIFPERNVPSRRGRRAAPSPAGTAASAERPADAPSGAVTVSGITKSFGGLSVLKGIDLELRPNEVAAILGPNGAGKTTLFNIIAGAERPDAGTVEWGGELLTGKRPHELARMGLARSFQDARMFSTFTVYEYMVVTAHTRRTGTMRLLSRMVPDGLTAEITHALEPYGLADQLDTRLSDLSYGQHKTLILASLVYWGPTVVLFDELAAGLDAKSAADVAAHVRALRSPERVICLVEHNLDFVWAAADRVVLLGEGRIVADGTPEQIREDPAAFATYFGKAEIP